MAGQKFATVDEYMSTFNGETKRRIDAIRSKIFEIMPSCEERISYNIPAYFLDGKMIVYFSGYEHHVSLYPGRTNSDAFTKISKKYASGKSTLKFPNAEPLPMDIIEEFIRLRIEEVAAS